LAVCTEGRYEGGQGDLTGAGHLLGHLAGSVDVHLAIIVVEPPANKEMVVFKILCHFFKLQKNKEMIHKRQNQFRYGQRYSSSTQVARQRLLSLELLVSMHIQTTAKAAVTPWLNILCE
jgi:hypothetical protein